MVMSDFWIGFSVGVPVGTIVLVVLVVGLLALQPRWLR
jgi:hypothetical protein